MARNASLNNSVNEAQYALHEATRSVQHRDAARCLASSSQTGQGDLSCDRATRQSCSISAPCYRLEVKTGSPVFR
eukprot:scaffold7054_cov400-Pinguiococcus_pyrenoidosus.AAC.3